MTRRMRYVMVGGFLGAGKTTTLARLAAEYRRQGLNVGIVTNDQAADLVDTELLRGLGFAVEEVAELVRQATARLAAAHRLK